MMDSIRILLVRHGETEWNRLHRFQGRSDVPLNAEGIAQAHALAAAVKGEAISALYTSPLARALQTARIIHAFHAGVPLFVEHGLAEMDLGAFEGMDAHQWARENPEFLRIWQQDPSRVRMPGGETLEEVQARALMALDRICRSHYPGECLLLSSHNFLNLSLLCHAMGVPLARCRSLRQGTATLNRLMKQGDRIWVERLDDRSHLQDGAGGSRPQGA
jgi:probable phosphoglycerate mutase